MSSRTQVLMQALQALQSYDQFGIILNHKQIITDLLKWLHETSEDDLEPDPTFSPESRALMKRAIKKAKKI